MSIDEALTANGYAKCGGRYVRPGGRSASVTIDDGRSFHHSATMLFRTVTGIGRSTFSDYDHGGDCRVAVKAAAERLGLNHRHNGQAAPREQEQAGEGGEAKASKQSDTSQAIIVGTDDLPEIDAGCHHLPTITSQAWDAIQRSNKPARLFLYGGLPVRIEAGDDDEPTIRDLTVDRFRHEAVRCPMGFPPGGGGEHS